MKIKLTLQTMLSVFGLFFLFGCAPLEMTAPNEYGGESVDLLQDDMKIVIVPNGGKFKISITIEGSDEVCEGEFTEYAVSSGIPLFTSANRSLKGSFKKVSSEACIEAIGGSGGVERLIDIRGPSIWGQTSLQICNDSSSETFCFATNTFSIDQMGGEE